MPVMKLSSTLALVLSTLMVHGCCGRMSKCADLDEHVPSADEGWESPLSPPRSGDLSPSPDAAVVVTNEGIVALDETGKQLRLIAPQTDVGWCRIDPRGRVLWFQHGEGGTLSLFDLDSDAPPVTVLEHAPETIVIAYPDGELFRPRPHEFANAVVVHMGPRPRMEAALGCDGDMAHACFGDVEDLEAARATRLNELRKQLAGESFPARLLTALGQCSRVYERPGDYVQPGSSIHGPKLERVSAVPREACREIPEDCGTAIVLPGTRYWRVVVGDSRGDVFHETHQLYDPERAEFFDPRDPKARSPQPLATGAEGEAFVPTWVSPSGELGLGSNALVRLDGGTLTSGFGLACGFWGGGWELDGN